MRNLTWGAACGLAFFLLCLGGVMGVAFPAHMAQVGAPVIKKVMDSAYLLHLGSLKLALAVLAKNCFVLLCVLLAEPSYARLKRRLFKSRLAAYFSRITDISVAFFPAVILVLNGAVLSWSILLFWKAGVPLMALLGGTLPHGVIELAALVLASAMAFYQPKSCVNERMEFFMRLIFPLLVVAALVEAYISPTIMVRLWS